MDVTSSPCVMICMIDATSGLCIGCARSGSEIGRWAEMAETERLAIMATLPDRFQAVTGLKEKRAEQQFRTRKGRRRKI